MSFKNDYIGYLKPTFALSEKEFYYLIISFILFLLSSIFLYGEELEINKIQDSAFLGPNHLSSSVILKASDDFSLSRVVLLSERYTLVIPEFQNGRIFRETEISNDWKINPKIYDRTAERFVEKGIEEGNISDITVRYDREENLPVAKRSPIEIVVKATLIVDKAISHEVDKAISHEFIFQKTDYMAIKEDIESSTMDALYKDVPILRDIPLGIVRIAIVVQEEFLREREFHILLEQFLEELSKNQWRLGKSVFVSLWSLFGGEGEGYRITGLEEVLQFAQRYNNDFWEYAKKFEPNRSELLNIFSLIKRDYGASENINDDDQIVQNDDRIVQNDNYFILIDDFTSEKMDRFSNFVQDFSSLNIGVICIDTTPDPKSYLTSEMGYLEDPFNMNLQLGQDYPGLPVKLAFRVLCNTEYGGDISNNEAIYLPRNTTAVFYHGMKIK